MPLSTYQFEREGLVIGDGTNYDVVSIQGLGMPDVRGIEVPRLDADGSFRTRREDVGDRQVILGCWVLGSPGLQADQRITAFKTAFVRNNDIKELKFNLPLGFGHQTAAGEERVVYGYVRRREESLREQENVGRYPINVEILCTDPRIYDATLQTLTITPAVVDVGFTFPLTFPMTFASATSNLGVANNAGNEPTFPTARIDGPISGATIYNDTTGESLQIRSVLSASEYLEIDFLNRIILLNGTASRYYEKVLQSTFFSLLPGDNTIRFTASATGGGTSLLFRWRSAWL